MKRVYQTRFGGADAPQAEQGNCMQACIASILEIPLEEAFDTTLYPDETWFDKFNEWLAGYQLACVYFESSKEHPIRCTEILGYHINEVWSGSLKNTKHAVVCHNDRLVHNPNERCQETNGNIGVYMFICLNPAKWKNVL